MSSTGISAPRRVRAVIVLLSLHHFDRMVEGLDLSAVGWISDSFRTVIEEEDLGQECSIAIRNSGRIDLIFRASESPGNISMRAVLTAAQVLSRWKTLEGEALQRGFSLPKCKAAVHFGDFVSPNDVDLLGSDMELALRIAGVARDEGIFASERILEYLVARLPDQWELIRDWEAEPTDPWGMISDDIMPLSEEFEGQIVRVGPGVKSNRGNAIIEFQYWGEAGVPGRSRNFPILRVSVCPDPNAAVGSVVHGSGDDFSDLDHPLTPEHDVEFVSDPVQFGRYELLRKLGEGGMGVVWLGRDRYGNNVAIKQLLPGYSVSASQLKRFQREAAVMSRLSHRNIARIHEVGEVEGATFIAMEYVEGASLAEVLSRSSRETRDLATIVQTIHRERSVRGDSASDNGCLNAGVLRQVEAAESPAPVCESFILPIPQSLSLMQKICSAIHFAHEHGVLHRDLKPHNIMIRQDGEPVVMDFGLAKLKRDNDKEHALSLSFSGQIIGTLGYMAPEQAADSKHINERADVYALGAILYEMLTGRRAFRSSGDLYADVARLRDYIPTSPRKIYKLIERDLDTITLKALHPDPGQRYSTARLLADDLRRFAIGEAILARKPSFHYRLGKRLRRHRGIIVAAAAVVALSIAFGLYAWLNYQRQWGRWVKVYEKDFTVPGATLDDFEIRDPLGIHPALASPPERDGLAVEAFTQYWLKDIRVTGSVRVVAEVIASDLSGNIGIFLNAAPGALVWKTIDPRGYSGWINYSALDTISPQRRFAASNSFAAAVPTRLVAGQPQQIMFERDREKLSLSLNDKICTEWVELLPLQGIGFDRVGLRSWGEKVRLRSLAVYRLALPESSTPLTAGDALLEAGHAEDAIRRYRDIAEDFRGHPIAPLALAKAYLTAAEIQCTPRRSPTADHAMEDIKDAIKTQIARSYPDFTYRHLLNESDALLDWSGPPARKENALAMLPGILGDKPDSRIIPRMLSYPSSSRVPDLLAWVAKTRSLTALNLNGKNLENINGLRGAPLQALQLLQNRKLASIEPLRGMPLRFLDVDGHMLPDIEPLRGMPLESLRFASGEVRDLSPLRGMPLKLLRLSNLKTDDFEPLRELPLVLLNMEYMPFLRSLDFLRGMPLGQLSLKSCPGVDLEPLRGLPLTSLGFENCRIEDLSPLKNLALTTLTCRGAGLADITPLRGMPLRKLDISRNRITSLEALASLPLRRLACHTNLINSLVPLEGLRLDFLDCQNNPLDSLGPFLVSPPAEFFFASDTLPEAEYERAIALWSKNSAWASNTRRAEIALALRRSNVDVLRRLAFELNGRRYLHVEQPVSWMSARKICERLGAHLLTLTSKEEADVVYGCGAGRGWLGITKSPENPDWRWLTGEPCEFQEWISHDTDSAERTRAASISDEGRRWFVETPEDGAIRPFTIEWDD